jgi:hypothetical protein
MTTVPKCREGKKVVAGYFDPKISRKLRQIAAEEDSSVQALLEEAIVDLISKRSLRSANEPQTFEVPVEVRQRMGRVNRTINRLIEAMTQVQEDICKAVDPVVTVVIDEHGGVEISANVENSDTAAMVEDLDQVLKANRRTE